MEPKNIFEAGFEYILAVSFPVIISAVILGIYFFENREENENWVEVFLGNPLWAFSCALFFVSVGMWLTTHAFTWSMNLCVGLVHGSKIDWWGVFLFNGVLWTLGTLIGLFEKLDMKWWRETKYILWAVFSKYNPIIEDHKRQLTNYSIDLRKAKKEIEDFNRILWLIRPDYEGKIDEEEGGILKKAKKLIVKYRTTQVSMWRRKLNISRDEAESLVKQLVQAGYVSAKQERSGSREAEEDSIARDSEPEDAEYKEVDKDKEKAEDKGVDVKKGTPKTKREEQDNVEVIEVEAEDEAENPQFFSVSQKGRSVQRGGATSINLNQSQAQESAKGFFKTRKTKKTEERQREILDEKNKTAEVIKEATEKEADIEQARNKVFEAIGEYENLPPKEQMRIRREMAEEEAGFWQAMDEASKHKKSKKDREEPPKIEEVEELDSVEDHREAERIEGEKEIITAKKEHRIKQVKRELSEKEQQYNQNKIVAKMIELAPYARTSSVFEWKEDVEEKEEDEADDIIEKLQKFIDDLEAK